MIVNVLWGKFTERDNLKQTKFLTSTSELPVLYDFRNSAIDVKDLIVHNEHILELNYCMNKGFIDQNVNTNIIIASFTTALAQLKLYSVLEILGDRDLYCDTDSVVFKSDPTYSSLDPPKANFLGDLTDEIDDGGEEYIQTWVCGGPKNYTYKTNKSNVLCKVRGFTLNVQNSLTINHETIKELVKSEPGTIRTISESKIMRDPKTKTIHTVKTKQEVRGPFAHLGR